MNPAIEILERAQLNPAIDTDAFNIILDAIQDLWCILYPCPDCQGRGSLDMLMACPTCYGYGNLPPFEDMP